MFTLWKLSKAWGLLRNAKIKKALNVAGRLEGNEKLSKDEGISDHLQAAQKFHGVFCRTNPPCVLKRKGMLDTKC